MFKRPLEGDKLASLCTRACVEKYTQSAVHIFSFYFSYQQFNYLSLLSFYCRNRLANSSGHRRPFKLLPSLPWRRAVNPQQQQPAAAKFHHQTIIKLAKIAYNYNYVRGRMIEMNVHKEIHSVLSLLLCKFLRRGETRDFRQKTNNVICYANISSYFNHIKL